jgi:hypothetical protein
MNEGMQNTNNNSGPKKPTLDFFRAQMDKEYNDVALKYGVDRNKIFKGQDGLFRFSYSPYQLLSEFAKNKETEAEAKERIEDLYKHIDPDPYHQN